MKTELPAVEPALGDAFAPTFAEEQHHAGAATVTGKRKTSLGEGNIDGETEEQKQKRARGRPRLDTKDETAADRRRTQIRLAQRAYRHRKDNAITNLEEKVSELQKHNADMSREFHRFYDLVMAEGLLDATSEVAQRFKAVTENFMRLSGGNTGEAGYISPEDERTTVVDDFQGRNDAGTGSSAEGQSPQKSMPESNHSGQQNVVPVQETDPDAINSYEVVAQATPDNASFPLYGAMEVVPNLSGFASINSPFATLPLTSSLSYHELSFGRRLQRRTTERGLFLASMPNPPPERYAAVFGFSLLFESRDSIMRRLSQQLANMVMPFQDQANTQKGPFEEKMDQRIRLTFGFEKEFLNADEVEMYLHERGIIIPQQVEFVDAEVDVNDLSDAMPPAMPPAMNPQGYYSPQSSAFDGQNSAHVPVTMAMSVAGNPNNAMVQHMQMQPSNAASMLPCMCGPGMNNVWGATSWQKAKLTISVGVLVEELASKSVCMGMHPGVRIKDVNNAIRVAAGLV